MAKSLIVVLGTEGNYIIVKPDFSNQKMVQTQHSVPANHTVPFGLPIEEFAAFRHSDAFSDISYQEKIKLPWEERNEKAQKKISKKKVFKKLIKGIIEKAQKHGADYIVVTISKIEDAGPSWHVSSQCQLLVLQEQYRR